MMRRYIDALLSVRFLYRLIAFGFIGFAFASTMRPAPTLAIPFFFAWGASGLWLAIGAFQSVKSFETRGTTASRRGKRILAWLLVAPVVFIGSGLTGQGLGEAIKPYTQQEIDQAKADEIAEKAEKLKLEAEQRLAKDKAAEEERQKKEQEARQQAIAKAENEAAAAQERQEALAQNELDRLNEKIRQLEAIKTSKPLRFAYESCALEGQLYVDYVTIADDGNSMFVTTLSGEDIYGFMSYACIARNLGMSDPLVSSIESTNSLAGTKTWNENGLDFQWSYHPTSGLNLSIIREKSCFLWLCS